MIKQLLLSGILLTTVIPVYAKNLLLIKFELIQDGKRIESGSTFISQMINTWKKGYAQRYIYLNCHQLPSGKIEKQISTKAHFAGLRMTHQIVDQNIELHIDRTTVKSRLKELRALDKKSCETLAPLVVKKAVSYRFPATSGVDEIRNFDKNMKLRVTVHTIRGSR